jgi:hypothetical protein
LLTFLYDLLVTPLYSKQIRLKGASYEKAKENQNVLSSLQKAYRSRNIKNKKEKSG